MSRFSRGIEGAGKFFGEHVAKHALEFARRQVERFEVDVAGLENLQELANRPYLLAANHVKPEGKTAQQSALAPDALVLEHIVHEATNRELKIIAKSDDGWWSENLWRRFLQRQSQPFGKGMHEALGFIPIKKNSGSFNRDFVQLVERAVADGNPLLMFPEGVWKDTFDPNARLEDGVAFIAQKHGLPIVPAYLEGATSWEPGTEVRVAFGPRLEADRFQTREELLAALRQSLGVLQAESEIADKNTLS